METISNAAIAVKNAIWGSGENNPANETAGQEPLSGETGKGTPDEPYDKGNQEPSGASSTTDSPSTYQTTNPSSGTMSGAPTSNPIATGPGPAGQNHPEAGERVGDVRPTEANENRPNVNAGGFGTAEPSVSADPSSAQQPTQKQQGADRPEGEPTSSESAAIKEKKEAAEASAEASSTSSGPKIESEGQRVELAEQGKLPKDPNDRSGEPMKMHGAGREEKDEDPRQEDGGDPDRNKSVGQEGGHPHGKEKGTGEEYVKSTGLASEGGDFDATKPGAAREANRLLEQKGIHKEGPGAADKAGAEDSSKSSGKDEQKESKMKKLKDKLEEKLHIGTGKV